MVSRSWSELPELTEGQWCGPDLPGIGSRVDARRLRADHPQPGQPRDARRDAAADQPADDRRSAPDADRRRFPRPARSRCSCCPTSCRCSRRGARASRWSGRSARIAARRRPSPGGSSPRPQIIAFSDPNDLMSYPVPDQFADKYIESRLCPSVTNVTINVAAVNSLLGPGRCRQSAGGALRLRRGRAGRGADRSRRRQPTWRRSSPSAAPGARPTRA